MGNDITAVKAAGQGSAFDLLLDQRAFRAAEIMAASDLVPKMYRGRPQDILVAMVWGHSLGLQPMQALQGICVINGKPSIYGDLAIGLARSCGVDVKESFDESTMTATCIVTRNGQAPVVSVFSQRDAVKAKLWGKAGPWTEYPSRMMQMRARGFALRDGCADILQGLITREEAMDYPSTDAQVEIIQPSSAPAQPVRSRSDLLAEKVMTPPLTETPVVPEYAPHQQRILALLRPNGWTPAKFGELLTFAGLPADKGLAGVPPEAEEYITGYVRVGYEAMCRERDEALAGGHPDGGDRL